MKSKTSFFKVSPAVIREDVRRFWAIPVLAFIGYFLFGILPILVDYHLITDDGGANISSIANIVEILLSGQNPFIVLNMIWVPILSGILIFSYLHRTGTVMSVHSQPVTRNTLFHSHFISSLLFGVLPILAAGIILLVIAKPIYLSMSSGCYESYSAQQIDDAVNIFSRMRILQWIWDSCLVTLFILAVTIFGGMITGTTLHHFIAAIGFNVVVPAIYILVRLYFEFYLYGYIGNEIGNVQYLSPVLLSCLYQPIGLKWSVIYLIVIAALLLFSVFLYNRRRLERAADGVVFKAANVGITLLFGFLGMSLMGFTFQWIFEESAPLTVFGYICGAVLAMVIIRMIIMKTIKIFDRQLFRMVIAYLIAAVIFFAVIVCDLTGYESRVPDAGSVDEVAFMDSGLGGYTLDSTLDFEDASSIEFITKLHEEIVENRDLYDDGDFPETCHIEFVYIRGDRDSDDYKEVMKRGYDVPTELLYRSASYRALLESDSFNESLEKNIGLDTDSIISATFLLKDGDMPISTYEDAVDLTKEEGQELYNIYRNELLTQNAQQRITRMESLTYASFDVIYHADDTVVSETASSNFAIKNTDTACIQWLREHGYSAQLESQMMNEWSCAVISTITPVPAYEWRAPEFVRNQEKPSENGQNVIVTDKDQMMKLYEKMRDSELGISASEAEGTEDQAYWLTFYCYEDGSEDRNNSFCGYIAASDLPEGVEAPKGK